MIFLLSISESFLSYAVFPIKQFQASKVTYKYTHHQVEAAHLCVSVFPDGEVCSALHKQKPFLFHSIFFILIDLSLLKAPFLNLL